MKALNFLLLNTDLSFTLSETALQDDVRREFPARSLLKQAFLYLGSLDDRCIMYKGNLCLGDNVYVYMYICREETSNYFTIGKFTAQVATKASVGRNANVLNVSTSKNILANV